jgi:hypothetical protein
LCENNGSDKYGTVQSSVYTGGVTEVSLIQNADFQLANGPIFNPRISYIDNPEGFPVEFSFIPSIFSGLTIGNGSLTGKISIIGRKVNGRINFKFGATSALSATLAIIFNYPVPHATIPDQRFSLGVTTVWDNDATPQQSVYLGNTVHNATYDAIVPQRGIVNGSYVNLGGINSNEPITWAENDELSCFFEYPMG